MRLPAFARVLTCPPYLQVIKRSSIKKQEKRSKVKVSSAGVCALLQLSSSDDVLALFEVSMHRVACSSYTMTDDLCCSCRPSSR